MINKIYYYVSGNTAKGLINFLPSNVHNIERVFVLNHPSHLVKTNILKQLMAAFETEYQMEVICSPFGSEYLEGVIIREKSLAVIADTVNSDDIRNTKDIFIPHHKNKFATEEKREREYREQSYKYFSTALSIHDDLEEVYIQEMDFSKADQITDDFIKDLLENISTNDHTPHVYRRMFGATTIEGPVNIVPQIIEDLSKRVYIKGRAGTGKSVFMRKVANACKDYGFDLELYHCSFDPNSIDMVLVRELDFCIFDSTAPHEYHPEKEEDIMIDLYQETVTLGVDEKFSSEIEEITQRYKSSLHKGVQSLQQANSWQEKIEKNYKSVDHNEIQKITTEVLNQIKKSK